MEKINPLACFSLTGPDLISQDQAYRPQILPACIIQEGPLCQVLRGRAHTPPAVHTIIQTLRDVEKHTQRDTLTSRVQHLLHVSPAQMQPCYETQ